MLVFLSDLHFSDGTTSANTAPEVFSNLLFNEIRSRASSKSKNVEEVHFVLAGDIIDIVRTDKWLMIDEAKRPWNGNLDPDYAVNTDPDVEIEYNKILDDIIAQLVCQTFISEINKLAAEFNNIPVKITYIIGNHDRAINYYDSLKQKIKDLFPSINVDIVNYLHSPEYSLLCRHGNEWDSACFGYEFAKRVLHKNYEDKFHPEYYKVQNISEVVTTEIMSGIVFRLNYDYHWKGIHDDLIEYIKDLNNVRPALSAIDWLAWSTASEFKSHLKTDISRAIYYSLEAFLDTKLAIMWDNVYPDIIVKGDFIDRIQLLKKFLNKNSFGNLHKAMGYLKVFNKFAKSKIEYCMNGAIEDFKNHPDVQFVVYGHTHYAKEVVINAEAENCIKTYINTGTYLPLIQEARINGYGRAKRMTLTFIYNKNEDRGSIINKKDNSISMEFWNGLKQKEYI